MTLRKAIAGIGLLLLTLGLFPMAAVLQATDKDWWWTNKDMKLTLAAASSQVEVYVQDRPLAQRLGKGDLRTAEGVTLSPDDFTFRLNKLHEMILPDALWAAVLMSSGLALLACALALPSRREPPR